MSRASSTLLALPDLDSWRRENREPRAAFFRALAGIACRDGQVSLPEFAALTAIANTVVTSDPAGPVAADLILHALESRPKLDACLNELSKSSAMLTEGERRNLLPLAAPILRAQGHHAQDLTLRLGKALRIELYPDDLNRLDLPEPRRASVVESMVRTTIRLVRPPSDMEKLAELASAYGEHELAQRLQAAADDRGKRSLLVRELLARIESELARFREQSALAQKTETLADDLVATAELLRRQIEERLAIVEQRVALQKKTLEEDLIDLTENLNHEIAAALHDRFHTDDWRKSSAWDNFARSQAGKAIELRIERLKQRYVAQVNLLTDELRLFQNELRATGTELVARHRASEIADLVPKLSLATRFMNVTDSVVTATLATSVVAGIGVTGLVTVNAIAFPVVAPVAATIGGAIALGSLYKLITNPRERRQAKFRDARKVIEEGITKLLEEVPGEHARQLDEILRGFQESATALLTPIVLNAQAAEHLRSIRGPMAERVIAATESRIGELRARL